MSLPPWRLLTDVDGKISHLLADGKRRTVEEIATELGMRDRLAVIRYVLDFLPNYAEVLRENRIVKYTLKRFRNDNDFDYTLSPVPTIIIGYHAANRLFRARFRIPNGLPADELIRQLNQKTNQAYFYEHPAQAGTYVLRYPEFGSQLILKPKSENTFFALTYKHQMGKLPANARQIVVQFALADGRNWTY